jgi:hypothetical protein
MQELQKANVEGMAASAKAARTAKADGATMRVVEQRTARFLGHPAQLIRTAHHNRAGKFPYQVDMVYLVIRKSGVYYFDLSADSAKPEGLDAALDKEWPAFVASISEAGGR